MLVPTLYIGILYRKVLCGWEEKTVSNWQGSGKIYNENPLLENWSDGNKSNQKVELVSSIYPRVNKRKIIFFLGKKGVEAGSPYVKVIFYCKKKVIGTRKKPH